MAKKDLAPGETLDAIGEYTYRAWIMTVEDAVAAKAIPCGLLEGGKVTKPITQGRAPHLCQLRRRCQPPRIVALRKRQDDMLKGTADDECRRQRSSRTPGPSTRSTAPHELKEALRKMYLIRRFEEGAEEAYMRGLIHGTMHLSIGQEATAVGSTMALRNTDYITSTHRGHGHCIGKGADPKLMFAEFFGKEEGYCRGRGGSMHIADVATGNLGANGIVGGGLPIAVGAALAIKKQKRDDVAMCFFGDGAIERRRLPRGAQHGVDLEAARGLRLREQQVWHVGLDRALDGGGQCRRPRAGLRHAGRDRRRQRHRRCGRGDRRRPSRAPARARARRWSSARPTARAAIRARDRNRYRTKEEIEEWKARDPIPLFRDRTDGAWHCHRGRGCRRSATAAEAEIAAGIEFARNGTDPDTDEVTRDVYSPEAA